MVNIFNILSMVTLHFVIRMYLYLNLEYFFQNAKFIFHQSTLIDTNCRQIVNLTLLSCSAGLIYSKNITQQYLLIGFCSKEGRGERSAPR